MITNATILQRSAQVLHSEFDDEVIMMNIEIGEYHNLNLMGNSIWSLLATPIMVKDICEALMEEYEVSAAACEQETIEFLTQLIKKKLVIEVELS